MLASKNNNNCWPVNTEPHVTFVFKLQSKHQLLHFQGVCNAQNIFTYVNPCWPGCTHDSRVFRESVLCTKFDSEIHKGILLGDSAYALKPYLMTPFLYPENNCEEKYNESHIRTRVTIENTFGYWKRRFQCILKALEYQPEFVGQVIIATACLHNLAMHKGDLWLDDGVVHELQETLDLAHQPEDNCPYDSYIDLRAYPSGKDVRGIIVHSTWITKWEIHINFIIYLTLCKFVTVLCKWLTCNLDICNIYVCNAQ